VAASGERVGRDPPLVAVVDARMQQPLTQRPHCPHANTVCTPKNQTPTPASCRLSHRVEVASPAKKSRPPTGCAMTS
jgi:hypothetical protein